MTKIQTEYFDSSLISEASYDPNNGDLAIIFHDNGNAYVYHGVPSEVWTGLASAESAGRFYSRYIKSTYGPATLVTAEEISKATFAPYYTGTIPYASDVLNERVEQADEPFEFRAVAHIVVPLNSDSPSVLARDLVELVNSLNDTGWAYKVSDVELVEPAVWR